MRKWKVNILITMLSVTFAIALFPSVDAFAQAVYENANGYEVVIDDEADLLTADEETKLLQTMQPITEYGNVAFKSVDTGTAIVTSRFADQYYRDLWGNESGTVFVIDMGSRMIYIHSVGAVYGSLKKSYANTITDNVYTYATKGEYAVCAQNAYEQIYTVLEGGRIAQPMKYISNALFAFLLSFVLLYVIVKLVSKAKKPSKSQLLDGLEVTQNMSNAEIHYLSEERTYIAVRDWDFWMGIVLDILEVVLLAFIGGGSSRSGGSRSGGGRSSGGGRRGGGGHRF